MFAHYVLSDPKIPSGALGFRGTGVTMLSYFDHLEAGYTIEQLLKSFPSVQREQAIGVLVAIKKLSTEALSKEFAA